MSPKNVFKRRKSSVKNHSCKSPPCLIPFSPTKAEGREFTKYNRKLLTVDKVPNVLRQLAATAQKKPVKWSPGDLKRY